MKTTIRDVARRAGVAISTVSLVINRKGRVRPETEKRIVQAIKELNYHPQRTARGLVTQKSGNFGFILSTDHFSQAEPFYTKIFLGTEFEARFYDYYILLTTVEREFNRHHIPRFLLERNVDGVILVGTVPHKLVEYIESQNIPIVFVDYDLPSSLHSAILIDNIGGIRMVTHYLIEKGHEHIAFIGGDMHHPGMKDRCEGFKQTIQEAGLTVDPSLIQCEEILSNQEAGFVTTNRLLDSGKQVTALIAANDAMAAGALRACRDRQLRVPQDIMLTGFDNIETAITARPTLTTVNVPKEKMGAAAVRHLYNVVKGTASKGTKIMIPVDLIVRESTDTRVHDIE